MGIVGLGYVRIPLSLGFARKGIRVIGFDIDEKKIELLSNGKSCLEHIASEDIDEVEETLFEGSAQPLRLEMEHFVHCIKTRETPISDGLSGLAVIRVLESLELKNEKNN